MVPGKPEVHSLLDADAARAAAPVAVAAPVVVVAVERSVPTERPPVRLIHRVGASLIGMFCLTFGVLAVVLVVRGVRHPVVFLTAAVMLSAAADFLPAVFSGRKPYLGWFFP